MRSLRPWRAAATALSLACSTVIAGGVLSGCGGDAAGPVQTLSAQGQPVVEVAGNGVSPGQPADATAYVVNHGSQPVTLVSASAVQVRGYRAGALADIGIAKTSAVVEGGYGWPPQSTPVRRFAGAELPRGKSFIVFGISGPDAGANYAAAGVRISYRYHGQMYSVIAWSGIMACVGQPRQQDEAGARCRGISDKFTIAVRTAAGVS